MVSKTRPQPPTPEGRLTPRSPRSSPRKAAAKEAATEKALESLTLDIEPTPEGEPKPEEARDEETADEAQVAKTDAGTTEAEAEAEETVEEPTEAEAAAEEPAEESTEEPAEGPTEETDDDEPIAEVGVVPEPKEEVSEEADKTEAEEGPTTESEEEPTDKPDEAKEAAETDADADAESEPTSETDPKEELSDDSEEVARPTEDGDDETKVTADDEAKEEKAYELPAAFLAGAPRIAASDIDADLTDEDAAIVEDFETAWKAFLEEQDPKILSTAQVSRTTGLMRDIEEIKAGEEQLKTELGTQLKFFEEGKKKVEDKYKDLLADATKDQREEHGKIQVHLDNAALADVHITQAIPWENFLETLNNAVAMSKAEAESKEEDSPSDSPKSSGKKTAASRAMKPSDRARFLIDTSNEEECEQSVELRSYRIDNALLNAHIKTLQNELERYEKSADTMDLMGKFLTEHNVWDILTKKTNTSE